MPQEMRPMKPENGWPKSHTNGNSAAITCIADSPGANLSYYITGFILTGGGTADGFSFLRRNRLTFNAASDTFIVTDAVECEPGEQDFAIVFGLETGDHTLGSMISKWEATGNGKGYSIEVLSTGRLKITFGDATTSCSITSTKRVNDNIQHQIVVNWEYQAAEGLNLYIDGESAADAVSTASLSTIDPTANLVVCGSDNKSFYFSTLGLYKTQILSSAEIAALWAGGAGSKFIGTETGISAAWNLDESLGTTTHQDLAAGNNDGTSSGATQDCEGIGFPIDPHALKETIQYNTGVMTTQGVIPTNVVNLPHAIKIGRNNPIFINETDGSFGLELYGYAASY